MTEETFELLLDAAKRVELAIRSHHYPAVVALEGTRQLVLTDYDYLQGDDAASTFENKASTHAKRIKVTRWVLAVPQVWKIGPGEISTRAVSRHPLRQGEQEAITWMAYDSNDGVDYGRVPYLRRPNGELVFGEPETITAKVWPQEKMPGYRLLCNVASGDDGNRD